MRALEGTTCTLVDPRLRIQQALEDVTGVLQVELVMEFEGRRQEARRVQDALQDLKQ